MKIDAFTKVGEVTFDATPETLVELLGEPTSRRGDSERVVLDYGSSIYVFKNNLVLTEVVFDASVTELDGHVVPFRFLEPHIRSNDPQSFEVVGFVVSPRFGIVLDPSTPWVTAIAMGELEFFVSLRNGCTRA